MGQEDSFRARMEILGQSTTAIMVEVLAAMGGMGVFQTVSSSASWTMKYTQAEPAQSSAHSGLEKGG